MNSIYGSYFYVRYTHNPDNGWFGKSFQCAVAAMEWARKFPHFKVSTELGWHSVED